MGHQERINGSGFPRHLQGDAIPLLARIAGLVTYYDQMLQVGIARLGWPHLPSLQGSMRCEIAVQSDLVVEFIRALGVYRWQRW